MHTPEHQTTGRVDPDQLEKEVDSHNSSKPPSIAHLPHSKSSVSGGQQSADQDGRLFLSDSEALDRARQLPDDKIPIHVVYSFRDRDNPRNWPRWKKWYITCFASMLNVLTYV